MNRRVLWLTAGTLAGMAITANAHHSWGAVYDGGRPVENLVATIVGPYSRRPHDNIAVMITNEAGEAEGWTVQWRGNRRRDEVREEYDFNHGDEVLITGRVARDEATKQIQMTRLVRPSDGWTITAREGRRGRR
jgi:hypothetical protein